MTHTLDVYFTSGVQSFIFTWEDEIKEWANSINSLLTGGAPIYKVRDDFADLEHIAETVSGAAKKYGKLSASNPQSRFPANVRAAALP